MGGHEGISVVGPPTPHHSQPPHPASCFLDLEGFGASPSPAPLLLVSLQLEGFDPSTVSSIFSTRNQAQKTDTHFLDSANAVSFFFEEKAFDEGGQLVAPKNRAINKIGHGAGW